MQVWIIDRNQARYDLWTSLEERSVRTYMWLAWWRSLTSWWLFFFFFSAITQQTVCQIWSIETPLIKVFTELCWAKPKIISEIHLVKGRKPGNHACTKISKKSTVFLVLPEGQWMKTFGKIKAPYGSLNSSLLSSAYWTADTISVLS